MIHRKSPGFNAAKKIEAAVDRGVASFDYRLKGDLAMQYLLLIYDDEKMWERMPEAERGAVFQQYMEFTQGIIKSGHHKGGAPLQPVSTATTVRQKGGKVVTTDGPFAETK